MPRFKIHSWLVAAAFPLLALAADPQVVIKTQGFLPFADAPIGYRATNSLTDQITELNRQIDSGKAQLRYEQEHGYLRSVLDLLGVPVSSQTLVFSKTSLQLQHISPSTPRALYFNDNVYVGQVLGARSIELIAFDAMQGAIFYVLNEQEVEHPRFERAQLDCIQCHISTGTRGIPGVMVRSVATTATGAPKGGSPIYTMGHETPLAQRWAGWYVTGSLGGKEHLGNRVPSDLPSIDGVLDASRFLTNHSDVVAHLVLAHQTQMHNLITETNYRYRIGLYADTQAARKNGVELAAPSEQTRQQYEKAAEATLRYLLFANEVPLDAAVKGSSSFAADFAARGPKDRRGRSLREFDLQKRLFKYPCSYLIYTDAFDAIPGPPHDYLMRRLFEVLTGRDRSPDFAALSADDRQAVLEILVDTKPGFAGEWKKYLQEAVSQVNTPGSVPAQP